MQLSAKEEENKLHFNILSGIKIGKEDRPHLNLKKREICRRVSPHSLGDVFHFYDFGFFIFDPFFFCIIKDCIFCGRFLERAVLCLVQLSKKNVLREFAF
jgi:hypothetical protein